MNGLVVHHSSANGHDSGDVLLSNSIGVMSSNTRVAQALRKLFKMLLELFTGEGTPIAAEELLGCHTACGTELLACCQDL